jgi:hypothetical protein
MSLRPCLEVRRPLVAALAACSLAAAPVEPAPAPTEVPVPATAEASPEPKADGPKLAIVPVVVEGAEDPVLLETLTRDLQNGMRRGRLQVLDPAEVARVAGDRCSDDACVARLNKQLGAAFVLRARVSVQDRDYLLRLELVAANNPEKNAESERVCELCGLAELRALTADQAARLLAIVDALAKPPPELEIASTPIGALVFVDGQLVGTTPVEHTVLEGKHIVRVMSEGYIAEEREVNALAGLRETLQIDLRRTPETLKLRGAGFGLLFTGLPVFAAGVALLALDGRQYRGRCTGDDIDINGACRFVFDTDWGGAGLAAAGTLLATAGAMLLLRTRDRPNRKLRARISPTYIGLSGSF